MNALGQDLKEELIRFASEVGFDRCRIARCDSPDHGDAFHEWLKAGAAGEMAYMARGAEKRVDPQKILPGARSVVSLALNYWQAAPEVRKLQIPTSNIQRSSKLQSSTPETFEGEVCGADSNNAARSANCSLHMGGRLP